MLLSLNPYNKFTVLVFLIRSCIDYTFQMKGQTDKKEYDFGTLWNLLMITANEITYPLE